MIRATKAWHCTGKVLYSKGSSALPLEFYDSCSSHFGMTLHHPTYIGVRSSQVRGLFLATDHPSKNGIGPNEPIFSIPLAAVQRVSTIAAHDFAIPRITLQNVHDAIIHSSKEFQMMAPQFYLGLQLASIASQIPDFKRLSSQVQIAEARDTMVRDIIPWVRILDDEDFNEQFIFGMYGMALDSWQRQSFQEMTTLFHRNITSIHSSLKVPFSIDLFRRVTRLVLARAEHVPLQSVFEGPKVLRKLKRVVRLLRRQTNLPSEVGIVPMLDLINHSNRPNVGVKIAPSRLLGGVPAVTVFSLTRIAPGQELCRHYNFALSRPNSLFRYGFLPFDLISIVENDAIKEHIIDNQDMLAAEAPGVVEKRQSEFEEIARLEHLFREARSKKPQRGRDGSGQQSPQPPAQQPPTPSATG